MITTNVAQRVFHIRYNGAEATCFAVDYEEKQYIVTAKHVVAGLKSSDHVEIFCRNTWIKVSSSLTGHCVNEDISVFSIRFLIGRHALPPDIAGLAYGQDVYFLGFPYSIKWELGQINNHYPMPFVKKGIVSAMFSDASSHFLFLDGHNNPGFSGGPVVFKPHGKQDFQVAAVISGYRYVDEQILDKDGNPLNAYIKYNTGIIKAFNIGHAIDLISANPNGLVIPKT